MNPPPKYIIVDSKYLGSEAAKAEEYAPKMGNSKKYGKQLSDKWIIKNIEEILTGSDGTISSQNLAIIKEIRKSINNGDENVCRLGAKVDNTGKITYYKYGTDGKITKETTTGKLVIWQKGDK